MPFDNLDKLVYDANVEDDKGILIKMTKILYLALIE